jgi:tetratricopeptide (TPR) repeat protein
MPRLVVVTLSLALAASACTKAAERDTRASTEARALCLAPTDATDAADAALRRLRSVAAADAARAEWTALADAWIAKARRSYDEGYYLHAGACAELALQRDSRDAAAASLRAMVQLNRHEFAAARDTALAVVTAHPRHQRAWGVLSDASLELGDMDSAIEAAQRMVDIKPNLPSYARAAHLAWLQGDAKSAKLFYGQAIRAAAPGEARAWVLVEVAEIFRLENDLAGADAGFALALSSRPDFPPALVGRARTALARGDEETARLLVARARAQNPHVDTKGVEKVLPHVTASL